MFVSSLVREIVSKETFRLPIGPDTWRAGDRQHALERAKESHSELQLNDVRNLLRSVEDLDRTYLDQWVGRLELAALYGEVQP
jgi:hypothetical protein